MVGAYGVWIQQDGTPVEDVTSCSRGRLYSLNSSNFKTHLLGTSNPFRGYWQSVESQQLSHPLVPVLGAVVGAYLIWIQQNGARHYIMWSEFDVVLCMYTMRQKSWIFYLAFRCQYRVQTEFVF